MHRLLITLLIGCASLTCMAQSKLRVSLYDKSQITIELDGKHFAKIGTSITVGDLPEGRHYIRIYAAGKNRFGRPYENMIYEGRVKTYYGNVTIFELDRETGSINVYNEDIDSFVNNPVIKTDTSGYNNSAYNNNNQQSNQTNTTPAPQTSLESGTLTESKLNSLKAKVDDKNADSQKLKLLKEGLIGEKITTNQVGNILDWFGFENSKEEFAEWAFDITVDKDNYSNLEAKFSYKEYLDKFDSFIKK